MSDIVELLSERTNYDTRKVINRSDKIISPEIMRQIEDRGITSEELNDLSVPIFKYRQQVTLHGHFDDMQTWGRIGHYKCLVRNRNETLGIKYHAIDFEKKSAIYSCLRAGASFKIDKDSSQWFAYIASPTAKTRAEAMINAERLTAQRDKIDTSLFTGEARVSLHVSSWGGMVLGYFAALVVEVLALPADNVDRAILNITGRDRLSIEADIRAKEEAERLEREARSAEYDREAAERSKIEADTIAKFEAELADRGLALAPEAMSAGYRLRLILSLDRSKIAGYSVMNAFKWGSGFRAVNRKFDTLAEAIEAIRDRKLEDRKHAKELFSKRSGYVLAEQRKPTQHAPKVEAGSPVTTSGAIVRRNEPKNGIEIVFECNPDRAVLDSLKACGYRWSGSQGLWYTRYTEAAYTSAIQSFAIR